MELIYKPESESKKFEFCAVSVRPTVIISKGYCEVLKTR